MNETTKVCVTINKDIYILTKTDFLSEGCEVCDLQGKASGAICEFCKDSYSDAVFKKIKNGVK
ncbi:MAG: hypothetical protein ACRCZO_09370 [Cetobacterium sp.]